MSVETLRYSSRDNTKVYDVHPLLFRIHPRVRKWDHWALCPPFRRNPVTFRMDSIDWTLLA